jgi:hypothetical protein
MISVPANARILLASRPVDLRKGAHGLAALAQEALAENRSPAWSSSGASSAATAWRFGLGYQRPRADMETIPAVIVPLAADHELRDEALGRGVRCTV